MGIRSPILSPLRPTVHHNQRIKLSFFGPPVGLFEWVCRLIRRLLMQSPGVCTAAQAVDIGGSRSQPHRQLGII